MRKSETPHNIQSIREAYNTMPSRTHPSGTFFFAGNRKVAIIHHKIHRAEYHLGEATETHRGAMGGQTPSDSWHDVKLSNNSSFDRCHGTLEPKNVGTMSEPTAQLWCGPSSNMSSESPSHDTHTVHCCQGGHTAQDRDKTTQWAQLAVSSTAGKG